MISRFFAVSLLLPGAAFATDVVTFHNNTNHALMISGQECLAGASVTFGVGEKPVYFSIISEGSDNTYGHLGQENLRKECEAALKKYEAACRLVKAIEVVKWDCPVYDYNDTRTQCKKRDGYSLICVKLAQAIYKKEKALQKYQAVHTKLHGALDKTIQ